MSPAHACFRSALSQAFRSHSRAVAASYTVPAFLVPALTSPSHRSFSSGKRRSQQHQPTPHTVAADSQRASQYGPSLGSSTEPIHSRIPFPAPHERGDIQAWLAAIEPYLPTQLRLEQSSAPDISATVTPLDLSCVLDMAQKSSLDIISHLGLVQGRWQVATWIGKKLVEEGRRSVEPPGWINPTHNILLQQKELHTLDELSEQPIRLERLRAPRKSTNTLDGMAFAPDSINIRHVLVKQGLGQLWRSLGNLILIASENLHPHADKIMPHVLEIIAHLHHMGFMPDSVYSYQPNRDKHALQQPPTLHMLAPKILTALSDASWRAHEASVKISKDGVKAVNFLGYEVPDSRYKVQVSELGPELWLELVLWSCLHGGWVLDGLEVLRKLARRRGSRRWNLLSWREVLDAEEKKESFTSRWSLFSTKRDTSASPQDRLKTQRTISAEIVAAFVDGLVNQMRVGVGTRGYNPNNLIDSLKVLKKFLEKNNLSLGSASWDSIMLRLLESGGLEPEKRPDVILQMFELAPRFGAEISAANASGVFDRDIPYYFEPTTITLSLLHRALRAFITIGDSKSAVTTLELLQRYTDDNKQKSIKDFFAYMKNMPLPKRNETFTSTLPPMAYPAFDTMLPVPLLAKLLDLATDSQLFDLARWMLFSKDLDGPLIRPELHDDRSIAASIVRFGTVAGENDMVLQIVEKVKSWNPVHKQARMPAEVLTALFCSQIKLRQWNSVEGMQEYVRSVRTFRPRTVILSTFAAELMRASTEEERSKQEAQRAFADLLFAWDGDILKGIRNELYCILGIVCNIDNEWKQFCSQFLTITLRQPIKLSIGDFNRILLGVLDGYGSSKGKALVEFWCHTQPKVFEPLRAPGGLVTMPRHRVNIGQEHQDRPEDLVFEQDSGSKLVLQGRLLPNAQTIWNILRKVQEEVAQAQGQGRTISDATHTEVQATVKWAVRILYYLGYEYEDTLQRLGSLAGFAEIEIAVLPNGKGQDFQSPPQLEI